MRRRDAREQMRKCVLERRVQRLDGKHALLRAGAAASGCVSEAAMIAAAFLASRLPAGRSECAPKTAGPAGSEWLHRIGHGTAGLGRIIFGMATVASQLSQRLRVCGRVHACACRVGREQVTVGCDVIPKIQRTKYLCDRKLLATVTKKDWRACSCRERAAPIASVSSGPMLGRLATVALCAGTMLEHVAPASCGSGALPKHKPTAL